MTLLRVRLLGTFQVEVRGIPANNFESNKVRALLAYLVVENRQAHNREKLAALFWPESSTRRATSNLSQAIYNLRQLIQDHQAEPPHLLRSREMVQFNPGSDFWLDVEALNQGLDEHPLPDPSQPPFTHTDLENFQATLALYQGDFLEGFTCDCSTAFDEWLIIMRQRLLRRTIEGYHLLAEAYAANGDIEAALPYAWRQVTLDPLDESACRQLIGLLDANGQRSQALVQFDRLRVLLAEELRVEPEPETVKLRDQIRGQASPGASLPQRRDNLPSYLSPLVGRQAELAEVCQRLESPDCRLLTVLGPGGSGKTRLALEAARLSGPSFSDGINFTALNPVGSPVSILPTIAESLDLPGQGGQDAKALLANFLRGKNLLLVLDGFEHLVDGADQLAELLQGAPRLKILVTSRTRLNLQGESLYRLAGMGYPGPGVPPDEILNSDAVQLLLSGLQQGGQGDLAGTESLDHLLRICMQVQGMPLGILLAAFWGATFSLAEIAEQVTRSLDFLSADWADVPARQRSLRATFDHTWGLLDEGERGIFRSLSVFRGAFTRRAARQVSGASPLQLRALVYRSLLESGTPGWHQVHELLRQYGREKLALVPEVERSVCDLHSAYYLDQLTQIGDELKSEGQGAALSRIDLEHENYRAAWDWNVSQGLGDLMAQALDSLCLYYDLRYRYKEGESACRTAAEMAATKEHNADHITLLLRLKIWQARFNRLQGNPDLSHKIHQECISLLDHLPDEPEEVRIARAFLFLEMGNTVLFTDLGEANRWYQASLNLYRSLQEDWGMANALCGLGESAVLSARFNDSITFYQEGLSLFRTLGDPRGIVVALTGLGGGLFRVGALQESEECMRETIQIYNELEDHAGVARSQYNLTRPLFIQGRYGEAIELFRDCAPILKDLGLQYDYAHVLGLAVLVLAHMGLYQEARLLIPELLSLCQEIDYPRFLSAGYFTYGMIALAEGENSQACDHIQRSLSIHQEIGNPDEIAAETGVLGGATLKAGDLKRARQHLSEALQVCVEIKGVWSASWILPWVALYFAKRGEIERAVEFYATVKNLPMVANSRWLAAVVEADIMTACANYSQEVIAAIQERGRGLDLWETAGELLGELTLE